MPEITRAATPQMEQFRNDMIRVLAEHAGHMDAIEMLAVASYTVGQIIAMQDARSVTREGAMGVVMKNIEAGNVQAIAQSNIWMGQA